MHSILDSVNDHKSSIICNFLPLSCKSRIQEEVQIQNN